MQEKWKWGALVSLSVIYMPRGQKKVVQQEKRGARDTAKTCCVWKFTTVICLLELELKIILEQLGFDPVPSQMFS